VDDPTVAAEPPAQYGDDERTLEDIDFCLELLHSDIINVAYILELIADLNPDSDDYDQKRQEILDTMIRDAEMRNKAKLIDSFIRENVDDDKEGFQRAKADGTMDLESKLNQYVSEARISAVHRLAADEGIDEEVLDKYVQEYDYLQREKPEILQAAIKQKKGLRLMERSFMLKRLVSQLREIINTFSWE
jgi:type I restriction enzyme ecoR124II R protein